MQYTLEEAGFFESDLSIIIGSSTTSTWMNNQNQLNWELHFERNEFMNIKTSLQNMSFIHVRRPNNPWSDNWEMLLKEHIQNLP